MSFTDQITIDALQRFDRLNTLDEEQIGRLKARAELRHAVRGACLFELGWSDPRQLLLLHGELELQAGDGVVHRVRHDDDAARGPVARLRPSRYRVTACSDVRYLLIEQRLLDEHATDAQVIEVEFGGPKGLLVDDAATHPLMFDLYDDLHHGRIMVPSEREVAVRVGRALTPLGSDLNRLARTLAACPALTLKMVRAARRGGPGAPAVRSARAAVERLGAERVFALAVNCVLRESLRSDAVVVRERMRGWWETTMRVAALSAVLAGMNTRLDPAYAGLIGLLYSIAEPVVLGYADDHADLHDAAALDRLLYANRAELGRIMLTMWELPGELVAAASSCNHWGYDHAGEADYTDILLAAQWYALQTGDRHRRAPAADRVPALHRLGLDRPSAAARERILAAVEGALVDIDTLLQA